MSARRVRYIFRCRSIELHALFGGSHGSHLGRRVAPPGLRSRAASGHGRGATRIGRTAGGGRGAGGAPANYPKRRIHRTNSSGEPGGAGRPGYRLSRKAHVCRGHRGQQGDLLYLLEQPPFQAQVDACKAAVDTIAGAAPQCSAGAQSRSGTLRRQVGRTPVERRFGSRCGARAGGANRRRAGAAENRADQSRLYRDPRAH